MQELEPDFRLIPKVKHCGIDVRRTTGEAAGGEFIPPNLALLFVLACHVENVLPFPNLHSPTPETTIDADDATPKAVARCLPG